MNIKVLEKLGLNIKKYRLAQGFTQETLAEKIGIHPTYVGKLEGGKNNPSVKMLFKITRALGITLSDLFDFDK
ncbi:TPA: transcriptional regulator [Candidatus Gastranaerophilales bacterium HUM_10]|nr:MAG TPA: transcriptional regulator [Candidatus Gastranaerophilales bacterium HUM_10]